MKVKKKPWEQGINVSVSPKAYKLITKMAFESQPRMNRRQIVNTVLNLPKES